MTLRELLALVRNELDDAAGKKLWSDEELIEYAVDAENEASIRARLIIDSTTAAVTQIAVTAGNPVLTLDSRVVFIRRAKLALDDMPLGRAQMRDMDRSIVGWETETGTPELFITDYETGKIRLYRNPIVNDTLKMTVIRMPLVDMKAMDDTPEINARYHCNLRYWIMHRAYMKQDTETKDEKKAKENYDLFESIFGKRSSAVDEEWIAREQMGDDFNGVY